MKSLDLEELKKSEAQKLKNLNKLKYSKKMQKANQRKLNNTHTTKYVYKGHKGDDTNLGDNIFMNTFTFGGFLL